MQEEYVVIPNYLSLEDVMSKVKSYMTNHNYNLADYELSMIGHQNCFEKTMPSIYCYSFYLREYNNSKHEIIINIPCEKENSEIDVETLSKDYIRE